MIALSNASARQQKTKTKTKTTISISENYGQEVRGGVSWNKGSQRRGFTLSHLHNVQRILKRVHTK